MGTLEPSTCSELMGKLVASKMAPVLVATIVFDSDENAPAAGDTQGKLQHGVKDNHPFGMQSLSVLDWMADGTLSSTSKRTVDILNDGPLKPDPAPRHLVTTSLRHPTNMRRAMPSLSLLDWVTESPKPEPVTSRDIEAEFVTSSKANGILLPGEPEEESKETVLESSANAIVVSGEPEKEREENLLETNTNGIVVSGEPEKEREENLLEPAKENLTEIQRYTPMRAAVPLMKSRARPLSTTGRKVSDPVENGLRSLRHGRTRWHAHRLYGKFMFVAAIKGASMPPEILLRKIAAMTPCNDMPILRQPAGAAAFPFPAAPNRRAQPQPESDSSAMSYTPAGSPICSRQHAISASIVNLGLNGVFAFDPFASLCCNSALARGWADYDAHGCKYCKARAR